MKTAAFLCALAAVAAPSIASAQLIFVNNMSDAAVQLTAYDASAPAKVVAAWCVETGAYEKHELRSAPARLEAAVMKHDECKEPVLLNGALPLPKAPSAAAVYRLKGTAGKYTWSGPAIAKTTH